MIARIFSVSSANAVLSTVDGYGLSVPTKDWADNLPNSNSTRKERR